MELQEERLHFPHPLQVGIWLHPMGPIWQDQHWSTWDNPKESHEIYSKRLQVQDSRLRNQTTKQIWSSQLSKTVENNLRRSIGIFLRGGWGTSSGSTFDSFLEKQKPGGPVSSTQNSDFLTDNPTENYVRNNSKCFTIKPCQTGQLRYLFFKRTAIEWNHLSNNVVSSQSLSCFRTALKNQ